MTISPNTIRKSLDYSGYFILKRFVDRGRVARIRDIVIDFFEDQNALVHDYEYDPPGLDVPRDRGAHPLGLFDPKLVGLRKLIEPEQIGKLLENTYSDSQFTEVFHSDIHWNFGGTGARVWHRDNEIRPFATDSDKPFVHPEYNVYRSALYLDDHDDKTALAVIPGSHRNKIDIACSDPSFITLDVEAGDLIIFHCSLFHRSQYYPEKDRMIVFLPTAWIISIRRCTKTTCATAYR